MMYKIMRVEKHICQNYMRSTEKIKNSNKFLF